MDESPGTLTPEQRRQLEQLSAPPRPARGAIRDLVMSVHRDPAVRDRIPLESVCTVPVPQAEVGGWRLTSLLFTPLYEGGRVVGVTPPYAAIVWRWPEGEAERIVELGAGAPAQDSAEAAPSGVPRVYNAPAERLRLENELLHSLEQILSAPPDSARLRDVGRLYGELLPEGFYRYFWELAPQSREWLRPAATPQTQVAGTETRVAGDSDTRVPPARAAAGLETPGEEKARPPLTDLTEAVGRWLEEAQALAQEFSLQSVSDGLGSLERFQLAAGAQVAFVGETKNGKSRLVNLLLGREVLLETPLPTSCWSVQIRHSARETFEIETAPEVFEPRRPEDPSRWDVLLRDDPRGGAGRVRISLDDPWLKNLGAVLSKPPGLNRDEACDRVAREAASKADALILVLSAPHLLTRNERKLLEEEYARRRLTRMAVVVTKLDEIDAGQRPEVLSRIRAHVAEVSPAIRVFALEPGAAGGATGESVAAVRRETERLIPSGERGALRSHRVAWGLLAQFRAMAEQGKAAVEEQERERARRRAEYESALGALDEERAQWLNLLENFEGQRVARVGALRKLIRGEGKQLLEVLREGMAREAAPRAWWEKRMPPLLRQHRDAMARKYGPGGSRILKEDYDQLRQAAAQRLGLTLAERRPEPLAFPALPQRAGADAGPAEEGDGVFSRFIQVVLGPRIDWYRRHLAGIWETVTNSAETQRQNLLPAMEELVGATVDYYASQLPASLSEAYDSYSAAAQEEWEAWEARKREALQAAHEQAPDDRWSRLVADATARAAEIQAAVG